MHPTGDMAGTAVTATAGAILMPTAPAQAYSACPTNTECGSAR